MSAIQAAIAAVRRRGCATVDDILPDMEGYTRAQAIAAMQYARWTGALLIDGLGPRKGPGEGRGGSKPATYRIPPPVASVFDLGRPPPLAASTLHATHTARES